MQEDNYPKIHSLSTVGIRQHNRQDYLFHKIRTDFTGGNGLGKSIIADLMQLIFVPKRDIWEPGTDGIDKSKRKIEGIPLNKDYIKYGYAFLNIEKYENKYITIGVYITNTSRQPVRPFIIQQNEKFDKTKILEPFNNPIKSDDFYFDNGYIKNIKEISQHIFKKYNLFFSDFYKSENVNLYFELLFKNQITPINLTKENSLKSFAKVIQSFSRAKTLDINNSKSLQKFLFEDSEEIKDRFKEESKRLEDLLKDYRIADNEKKELQIKQQKLTDLQNHHTNFKEKEKDFLTKELIYIFSEYEKKKKFYDDNVSDLTKEEERKVKLQDDFKIIGKEIFKTQIENKSINENLIQLYGKLEPLFIDKRDKAKGVEDKLTPIVENIKKVKAVFEKYQSIVKIETQFQAQQDNNNKLALLNKLKSIKHFSLFEKSEWLNGAERGNKYYNKKNFDLKSEIDNLEELLNFYKGNNEKSLFQWAINRRKELTRNEELVIIYFKNILIEKPEIFKEGVKHLKNPESVFSNIIEEQNGIWVSFGNLKEFIPNSFIKKQIFTNTKKLEEVLKNEKEEIESKIKQKKSVLDNYSNLQNELLDIGFNDDLLNIYNNKELVTSFINDDHITEGKIEILKEVEHHIKNEDDINLNLKNATKNRDIAVSEITTINTQVVEISAENVKIIQQISDLQKQYTEPIQITRKERISKEFEEALQFIELLKTEKKLLKNDFLDIENRQKNNSGRITSNDKAITRLSTERPHLEQKYKEINAIFDRKKRNFKSNSDENIESVLLSKYEDINQEIIDELEKTSKQTKEKYEEIFIRIEQNFDETKDDKNEELQINKFNFQTLVNVLCGKIGLEGISTELEALNDKLISFGDLQMKIIIDVFSKVEKEYKYFKNTASRLNFFFKDPNNKISGGFHFEIDFNPKEEISIDWIEKMRNNAKTHHYGRDLFSSLDNIEKELNPQELIVSIAKKFSNVKNCDLSDLLNPKFYFNLKVGLYDDEKNEYSGSGGQAYTALALLGIGRLSVVEQTERKGIKFIIIEELSNIDDENFDIFPQIAKRFGYQLITMTPKPFGAYNNEEWYLHMLIRGKDKDINTSPMSFFKTNTTNVLLQTEKAEKI
jgi:hypothetical protein